MRNVSRGLATLIFCLTLASNTGCASVTHVKKWATGQHLVDATRAVTVEIRLHGLWGPVALGTGFVVDRRGLVVTNNHVAYPADSKTGKPVAVARILVCADASVPDSACAKATVLAGSPKDDLALLRVDRIFPTTTLIGLPRKLNEGEEVFARAIIGQLVGPSLVHGHYVGMSRMDDWAMLDRSYLVLDMPINPGGSGGPVFDRKRGELIGVYRIVVSFGGTPMAVAIPVAVVIKFLEENDPYLQPPPAPSKPSLVPKSR